MPFMITRSYQYWYGRSTMIPGIRYESRTAFERSCMVEMSDVVTRHHSSPLFFQRHDGFLIHLGYTATLSFRTKVSTMSDDAQESSNAAEAEMLSMFQIADPVSDSTTPSPLYFPLPSQRHTPLNHSVYRIGNQPNNRT